MKSSVINKEVAQFLSASLAVLNADVGSRGVPLLLDDPISFNSDGTWSRQLTPKPFWNAIVSRSRDALLALPEAESAAYRMFEQKMPALPEMRDADFQRIEAPSFEQAKEYYHSELLLMLKEYLEGAELIQLAVTAVGDLKIDNSLVDSMLWRHNQTWNASEFVHSVVVPIINFESEADQISVTKDLRIRRMSNEEKAAFWNPMDTNLSAYHIPQLQQVFFLAEINYTMPQRMGTSSLVIPALTQLLTALRLSQGGDVGALAYRDELLSPAVKRSTSSGQLPDYWLPADKVLSRYFLDSKAMASVLELFGFLSRARQSGRLRDLETPLRRFNQHYSRRYNEDKILDLTIVLESTLLFGDTNELSYKVGLRGAALLKDVVPPAEVFKLFRDLYKARSAIVHNGLDASAIEKKGYTAGRGVEDFVAAVAQNVRRVLVSYLKAIDAGGSVRKVTDTLDSVLVTQLRPDIT
jgi:Apea-like HEPN